MRLLIAAATIFISVLFLFVHLGAYSLWDDEANTALIGQGVWRTGDTSAVLDHNIVAYRNGAELVGTKERYLPPLQYYIAAPFVGPFAPDASLARFPFALIGLLTIGLMLVWLARATRDPLHWWLVCFGIIANVSLFLYFRQCRYYAPAIGATVLVAFLYYHWKGSWLQAGLVSFALLALLASNYLNFLALAVCLAVDYVIWGRRRNPIRWQQMLAVLSPVVLIGICIVLVWNPIGKGITGEQQDSWMKQHSILLWWNLREINQNEFGIGLLLLAAPIVAPFVSEGKLIWRMWIAAAIYVLVISIASPQPTSNNGEADVRYLVPLIPLLIAIDAVVLAVVLLRRRKWIIPLSLILLGTNIANGGIWGGDNPSVPLYGKFTGQLAGFSSTPTRFIRELIHPGVDPYKPVVDWMRGNMLPRQTVFVWWDYLAYPLMFADPRPIYAWQILPPVKNPALASLPDIHYRGHGAPMYVVMFGPARKDLFDTYHFPGPPQFTLVKQFDIPWFYAHRPELMWRDFPGDRRTIDPADAFDNQKDAIYIYAFQQPR